jgi:hypothetical protein
VLSRGYDEAAEAPAGWRIQRLAAAIQAALTILRQAKGGGQ